ncbi:MAG: Ig-like domain-containing protein [Candidatus Thermoplasmatota archaeon]|jgi:hypothetical protein|nr:Ig-like domain-containing protein [Candidatus Thermoplasmatota archaeon]
MKVTRMLALVLTMLFLGSSLTALSGAVGEFGSRIISPKIATLHVNVTYGNGSAASGIWVYVYNLDSSTWSTSSLNVTDTWGKTTVIIRGYDIGPCYLQASNSTGELWVRQELYVEPGRTYYRDIVLTPALPRSYTIEGTVRYFSNGTAINGAYYLVNGMDKLGRDNVKTGYTGADGRFSAQVAMSNYGYSINVYYGSLIGYSNHVFINSTQTTYTFDIRLRDLSGTLPLNVRFIDDRTGKPVSNPDIYIAGTAAFRDHLPYNYWFWPIDPSGWVNQTLGRGEYFYIMDSTRYTANCYISYETIVGVVMNDTPITREFRMTFPEVFRNITVKTREKGTGNIASDVFITSSTVKVRGPEYDISSRSRTSINSTGENKISLIPDKGYTLDVASYDYKTTQIVLPPGPIGDTEVITVELEKMDDPVPGSGTVSILVKDQKTGRPLPYYSVTGNGPSVYFYEETAPDGFINRTIPAGHYDTIEIYGNLGTGMVEDFTIADGQTKTLTILLTDRKDFDRTPFYQYSFRVVDESGSPLPNIYVPVVRYYGGGYDSFDSYSDSNGLVHLTVRPGTYNIMTSMGYNIYDPFSGLRQHNTAHRDNQIVVNAPGGVGPDVTLYSSYPFTEVTGAVKDLKTGMSLHSAYISITSGKDIGGGSRDMMFRDLDVVHMTYSIFSFSNGYFRLYGKDTIAYTCTLDGYFPKAGVFSSGSRALNQNIYLEPLLAKTTYINGTLMDYLGNPKSGKIYVHDLDREDYLVNNTSTGNDGLFSMGVYPGRFRIDYYNDTISESMELTVGSEGVENLQLMLTPETLFYGKVVNWEFAGIGNISVELFSGTDFENGAVTNEEGMFFFTAKPGSYTLVVGGSELYDGFSGGPYVATGFNEFNLTIVLENRTTGSVLGKVIGDGPTPEPIPEANVVLWDQTMTVSWPATSNETGEFRIDDVPYGTGFVLEVDPPIYLRPDEITSRSGYLNTTYGPFNLTTAELNVEVHLEYVKKTPRGFYNITSYSPSGNDVYLNEPIVIHFSHSMNVSTLIGNITIEPEPSDPAIEWRDDNKTLIATHSGFLPNTTYSVTVLGNILSIEGFRLFGSELNWNFTTGTENMTWMLDESFIEVADNGTVKARVSGAENLTVYMVIIGLGSYELTEGPAGTYRTTIDGSEFEWDTVYNYHFSDTAGGPDKAPTLSGSFKVPMGELTSIKVTVRNNMDWDVEAKGSPGMNIYIVIDGVGSFKLVEASPGVYEVLIDGENFNWSQTYSYRFSTTSGGAAPSGWGSYSGTQKMPKEKKEIDEPQSYWVFCCIAAFIVILLLILIVVIALVAKKGKGKEEDKEEAAGWGEE